MRCLRLLIPALMLVALVGAPGAEAQRAQPRIIAGSDVSISTYPFQVRLRVAIGGSSFLCGGAIRDQTHVITAGHCVTTGSVLHAPVQPGNVTVFYGSDVRSQQSSVGVSAVSVPTQYTNAPISDDAYDVALLTLTSAIDLSGPNAKAIPIAAPHPSQPKDAGTALVTGWGTTSENGSTSQTLQGTRVPLRPDAECANEYGTVGAAPDYLYYDAARAVCAGGGTQPDGANPDTCQGDSGGPLVVDLDSSSGIDFVLMGITSFGEGCGRQGTPAVYTHTQGTNISAFLNASSYQSTTAPTSGDFSSGTPGTVTRTQPPAPIPAPTPEVSPLPPSPVVATRDITRPTAKVSKLSCTKKRKCSFRIGAADKGGTVSKLSATVTRKVRTCKRRGDFRACNTTTRKKTLKPKRITGGFSFSATLVNATYTLNAVATDAAGNRSKALSKTFRVR